MQKLENKPEYLVSLARRLPGEDLGATNSSRRADTPARKLNKSQYSNNNKMLQVTAVKWKREQSYLTLFTHRLLLPGPPPPPPQLRLPLLSPYRARAVVLFPHRHPEIKHQFAKLDCINPSTSQ